METRRQAFQQALEREAEARISQMEREDYPFPPRFSRRDWLLWGVVTAGSLAMLLLGARL